MKGTAQTQCSGISPEDPAYANHSRICALYNAATLLVDRIAVAEAMLKTDRWAVFLPSVEAFLRQRRSEVESDPEAQKAQRIIFEAAKANVDGLRSEYLKILKKSAPSDPEIKAFMGAGNL